MARDGSGNHSLPYPNFIAGATILDTEVDANNADISAALTASIAKDGQTTPTANLPMGGYKHTGVAASANRTDYVRVTEYQDRTHDWPTVGGTADVITLTYSPTSTTAYAAGQKIRFKASGANTTNVTVNRDSLGAKALKSATGGALSANDITSGAIVEATYDGTDFLMTKSAASAIDITGLTAETTPAVADVVPIYDASAAANRKMTLENVVKIITALTAETAPAVGDEFAVYDASAAAPRKMTVQTVMNALAVLTSLTAPAVDDELMIYDLSATASKRITTVDLLEVVNVLTEDTSPDGAADFLLSYDTSASTVKKVKPNNIMNSGITELASGSLSGSTVDLTSIPETYAYLVLEVAGASCTANRSPQVFTSVNNGSSFGATDLLDSSGFTTGGAFTYNFTVVIHAYHTGPTYAMYRSRCEEVGSANNIEDGMVSHSGNIDALRVAWSGAGTFDAGTYALYGVR